MTGAIGQSLREVWKPALSASNACENNGYHDENLNDKAQFLNQLYSFLIDVIVRGIRDNIKGNVPAIITLIDDTNNKTEVSVGTIGYVALVANFRYAPQVGAEDSCSNVFRLFHVDSIRPG